MAAPTFERVKRRLTDAPILSARAVDTAPPPVTTAPTSEEEARRPIPAPFVTQRELERSAGVSPNSMSDMLERAGWKDFGSSVFLGRARGSPRIYPLVVLPGVHLARADALEPAQVMVAEAWRAIAEQWSQFVALLQYRVGAYPWLGSAIARSDAPAIAAGLAAGPDLLRAAEELAAIQLEWVDESTVARVGLWRKVSLGNEVAALPLPDELQSENTGEVGRVIAVVTSEAVRLLYRVGMPARALPLEPGTRIAGAREHDVPGVGSGVRRVRSLAQDRRR